MKTNDELAFPDGNLNSGMTLRDYFAAKEMRKHKFYLEHELTDWKKENETSAKRCFVAADAMLKERNK